MLKPLKEVNNSRYTDDDIALLRSHVAYYAKCRLWDMALIG